jgi:hypothetical protein
LRKFSIEHLWSLAVLAGIFVFLNLNPIRPHDFWWHMALGREILASGAIPTLDTYSYTMLGTPYPSYQMFWLMDVILYGIYYLGGASWIVFIHSLMVSIAYLLIVLIAYQLSKSWRTAALSGLFAAALSFNDWNIRPQSVSFFLGALMLWGIYKIRLDKQYCFLFPLIILVWTNRHGSYPVGFVFLGLWIVEEGYLVLRGIITSKKNISLAGIGHSSLVFGLSGIFALLNPRGMKIFENFYTMGTNRVLKEFVLEWSSPTIQSLQGSFFYLGLGLIGLLMLLSYRKVSIYHLAGYLVFGIFGIFTSRGILWFGIFSAPIIAAYWPKLLSGDVINNQKTANNKYLLNLIFGMLITGWALVSLPWFKDILPLPEKKAGLISSETPMEATAFILEHRLPPPVFHHMPYGSYLIWAAQPDYKVFVDSRLELYPYELWVDYLEISNGQTDWETKFEDYGVKTLMLSKTDQQGLIQAAEKSGVWEKVYQDEQTVIYVLR